MSSPNYGYPQPTPPSITITLLNAMLTKEVSDGTAAQNAYTNYQSPETTYTNKAGASGSGIANYEAKTWGKKSY